MDLEFNPAVIGTPACEEGARNRGPQVPRLLMICNLGVDPSYIYNSSKLLLLCGTVPTYHSWFSVPSHAFFSRIQSRKFMYNNNKDPPPLALYQKKKKKKKNIRGNTDKRDVATKYHYPNLGPRVYTLVTYYLSTLLLHAIPIIPRAL
jgi:hypothetical protein